MITRSSSLGCSVFAATLSIITVSIITTAAPAFAEEQASSEVDQIVVTGTRLETTQRTDGSSVTVITEQELEDGQYRNAIDALQQVPGLDIVQSGGPGGNAAIFLRGADSGQTLIMLDGIELNNPASPNRAFNMANLTLENIERIEIIRGPQSTIYGSDAMGGVINLISKKATKGTHANVSSEAGSYSAFNQVGNVSYGNDVFDVTSGITQQNVGGISGANARDGNFEQDRYDNTSLSNRLHVAPSELLDATVTTRYVNSSSNIDNFGGVGGDDPNHLLRSEEFFTRGEVSGKLLSKTLTPAIWASYTKQTLSDNNSPDEANIDQLRASFAGDMFTFGTRAKWEPQRYFSAVLGAESQRERADSYYLSDGAFGPYEDQLYGKTARDDGYFLESRASYDETLYVDAGVREDHHSIFGNRTTFKVAPAWLVTSMTKLRGSVGTGFKAPSLVQLYSSFGNPDLKAEDSVGWDVGIDQEIVKNRASLSLTFFHNTFDNLVAFNPATFILENIDQAQTEGFELANSVTVSQQLSLRLGYTYTDTKNDATGEALLRRPKNKGSMTAVYSPTSRIRTQLQWRVYGSRFDNDFGTYPPSRTTLGGYGLLDLAASYQLSSDLEIFSRIENIFDKEYEEVLGFGTMGAAAFAGIKLSM